MCHVGDILYHSKFLYVPSTHDTMLSRWEMENQHNRNRVVCRDAVRWNGFSFFKPKTRKIVLVNAMYVSLGTAFFSVASCRPTVLWVMYRLSYSQVSHCRYSQPRLSLSCKRKSHPIYRDVYSLCIIVLPFCLR